MTMWNRYNHVKWEEFRTYLDLSEKFQEGRDEKFRQTILKIVMQENSNFLVKKKKTNYTLNQMMSESAKIVFKD